MKAPQVPIHFPVGSLPPEVEAVRTEVRSLLERERAAGTWALDGSSWGGYNPELSRKLAAGGFVGMTWPKEYGGRERSYLERYVLTEELLAAGAPAGFHWIADRQSGPVILRFGSEEQKRRFLPKIAAAEISFCIGMSEPDSGSDLASIRTRARKVDGGWSLSGVKIWTSNAHRATYCIVLCRTEEPSDKRHAGMSQMIVDLQAPGLSARPVYNLPGKHDFNEVVFDDVYVPDDCLLGEPGNGWTQVTSELAYERAGPERFLTNLHVLRELVELLAGDCSASTKQRVGAIVSRLWALRTGSVTVARLLQAGELPNVESALVKDLGTNFQQLLPDLVREIASSEGVDDPHFLEVLGRSMLAAPAYTIQGGTTEILRGIIARGLRLR